MSKQDNQQALDDHNLWLKGEGGRCANLSKADLRGANLSDVNLSCANLSDANLYDACLINANLGHANLSDVNLRYANLSRAVLSEVKTNLNIPTIKNIHQKVYDAASQKGALYMGKWHSCGTTHCHAGWIVVLAGEEGKALEAEIGTNAAAALICAKSDPNLEKTPNWFASYEDALADMKLMAEKEASQ